MNLTGIKSILVDPDKPNTLHLNLSDGSHTELSGEDAMKWGASLIQWGAIVQEREKAGLTPFGFRE